MQDNKSPDEQIRFQIVSTPMYGILTRTDSASHHKELTEYSIFSMADINEHSIRYKCLLNVIYVLVAYMYHYLNVRHILHLKLQICYFV